MRGARLGRALHCPPPIANHRFERRERLVGCGLRLSIVRTDPFTKDNPAAAEKFGLHLVDRAALLAEFPELGQPYRKRANVRRLWCKPYFIYYRFLADEMAGMDSTPKSLAYDQRRSAVSE